MSDEKQNGAGVVSSLAAVTKKRDSEETLSFWIEYVTDINEGMEDEDGKPLELPSPVFECQTLDSAVSRKIYKASINPEKPYIWKGHNQREDNIDNERLLRGTIRHLFKDWKNLRALHLPEMLDPKVVAQIDAAPMDRIEFNEQNLEFIAETATLSWMGWVADAMSYEMKRLVKVKEDERKNLPASSVPS